VRWKKDHVTRTFAASRSELGLAARNEGRDEGGRRSQCAVAGVLAFDVDDGMRSTSNEPVDVTITYAPDLSTAPFAVGWDRTAATATACRPTSSRIRRAAPPHHPAARPRAIRRPGILKSSLAIGARNQGAIALCDIDQSRQQHDASAPVVGTPSLDVKDAADRTRRGGARRPVRRHRPDSSAVGRRGAVHRFADVTRRAVE